MPLPGILQGVISFAEATQYDEFTSAAFRSTTSTGWVETEKFEAPEERDDGVYTVQWSMKAENSKGGRDFGIQVSWREGQDVDANPWTMIDSITTLQVPSDNAAFLHSGFRNISLSTTGFFQVRLEFGQAVAGGGAAGLSEIEFITFRVGDNP